MTSDEDLLLDEDLVEVDQPCATCGHSGQLHVLREVEVPGNTVRETYCEGCTSFCAFLPAVVAEP